MHASYVRIHAHYTGRLGVPVGIFVAVDHLRRAGRLTAGETGRYLDIDDWFLAQVPEPPFYADGNSIGAVTWFTAPVPHAMRERIVMLQQILDAHGVEWTESRSGTPGEIIYRDAFQVGVVPRERAEPTPLPEGLVLGPTTPRSKRHLA